MTTIAFPSISRLPRELPFGIVWNTQVFSSPLTQGVSTIEIPGARWKMQFRLTDFEEADAALVQVFLMQLRGRANRAALYNIARRQPRGTIAGTPLVAGASQTGAALNIDGCTVGTTLLKGDFFGVNGELKMVVAAATANGSGQMTVTFEPPLRAAPADNAAITTSQPTALFMLESDEQMWSTKPGLRSDFTLSFIEVFA
jgi:hypothetical protein